MSANITDAASDAAAQEVMYLDPRSLVDRPGNTERGQRCDELVASIRTLGVREPVLVQRLDDGRYEIVAGHRRKYGAIKAERATVPCLLDAGTGREHLLTTYVENKSREGWTGAEEVAIVQQLGADWGMGPKAISDATGARLSDTRTAVKVAKDEIAAAVTAKYALSLAQAAVIAECSGTKDAVVTLTVCAEKEPDQWDHVVSRVRQDRAERKQREKVVAELTTAGITVIDPDEHEKAVRLSSLTDAKGATLTAERHATCPGHAVALGTWRPERTVSYCIDPGAHGHKPWNAPRLGGTNGANKPAGKMSDEAKAERRRVIANNRAMRAARPVRQQFVRELVTRRSVPKGVVRYAITEAVSVSTPFGRVSNADVAELIAGTRAPGRGDDAIGKRLTETPDSRLVLVLLAKVCAGIEEAMPDGVWRDHVPGRQARYLTFLASVGYALSPVERLVVTAGTPKASPKAAAAPKGEVKAAAGTAPAAPARTRKVPRAVTPRASSRRAAPGPRTRTPARRTPAKGARSRKPAA